MPIRYISTNRHSDSAPSVGVDFAEALTKGIAGDGGLFVPDSIPTLDQKTIMSFAGMQYPEIAFKVLKDYIGGALKDGEFLELLHDAYNFELPIEKADDRTFIMRLDQGPTASFKDFAARFMARMMERLKPAGRKMTILVATSGDTGSAVGEAFKGLDGFTVYILYPSTEVSPIQKKQLDSIGRNVTALEIDGTFDDCQRFVKQAFLDKDLSRMNLSSANSINIARILPQSVYYFYAFSRIRKDGNPVVFSVPSGNLGNSFGCELARRMGLPVKKLILASNSNNEVARFMDSGIYTRIEPSVNCISNAMNVGNPSNLARYFDFFGGWLDKNGDVLKQPGMEEMKRMIFAISASDLETVETMKTFYRRTGLLLEPHGAVGVKALEEYRLQTGDSTAAVCLETAHPAKFPETIQSEMNLTPKLPASLINLDKRPSHSVKLPANYPLIKEYLLRHE